MRCLTSLSGSPLRTYEALFRLPFSNTLVWRDVRALLAELGQVTEEPNGHVGVTRHGHTLILHPPHEKEVSAESTLTAVRHFLHRSETPAPLADGAERHWLVVINHHEARVFRSIVRGNVPLQVLPPPPEAFFRHAAHSKDFARGRERPDPGTFFGPLAAVLGDAGKILVFGCGKGTGSEMKLFFAWVKRQHPELAARIVGLLPVDEHHLTEAQLLAHARGFYAQLAPSLCR